MPQKWQFVSQRRAYQFFIEAVLISQSVIRWPASAVPLSSIITLRLRITTVIIISSIMTSPAMILQNINYSHWSRTANSNLRSSITIVPTTKITKSTISTTSWRISTIIWISPWIAPCYSLWSCEYFTTRVSTTVPWMSTAIIPFSISSTRWRSFTVSTNTIAENSSISRTYLLSRSYDSSRDAPLLFFSRCRMFTNLPNKQIPSITSIAYFTDSLCWNLD